MLSDSLELYLVNWFSEFLRKNFRLVFNEEKFEMYCFVTEKMRDMSTYNLFDLRSLDASGFLDGFVDGAPA